MFVTIARMPSLDDAYAEKVVQSLNEMRTTIQDAEIPGFVQAFLLRESRGGAMLMALWESRQALETFQKSEGGQRVFQMQSELFAAGKVELEEYRSTWQAVYEGRTGATPLPGASTATTTRTTQGAVAMESLSGSWSGVMMDAEGYQTRATLRLEQSGSELRGPMTFTEIREDESREHPGFASGKIDEAGNVFLEYQTEQTGATVQFTGQRMAVQQHAKACIYGTYSVERDPKQPMTGG